MKLHVHTFTWICGLVGCQPSSVAINFLDHVIKWAPHVTPITPMNEACVSIISQHAMIAVLTCHLWCNQLAAHQWCNVIKNTSEHNTSKHKFTPHARLITLKCDAAMLSKIQANQCHAKVLHQQNLLLTKVSCKPISHQLKCHAKVSHQQNLLLTTRLSPNVTLSTCEHTKCMSRIIR
jgi:hypothetical protein